MPSFRHEKPFMTMLITYLGFFSAGYTLLYFWTLGANSNLDVAGLPASTKGVSDLGSAFLLVNWIIDMASWISPLFFVRAIVMWTTAPLDPNLFMLLDLLFLRPMSWIATLATVNFALSKIPTEAEE